MEDDEFNLWEGVPYRDPDPGDLDNATAQFICEKVNRYAKTLLGDMGDAFNRNALQLFKTLVYDKASELFDKMQSDLNRILEETMNRHEADMSSLKDQVRVLRERVKELERQK